MRRASPYWSRTFFEFLDDDVAQFLVAGEDGFVFGNLFALLLQFFENFVDRELREAVELQLEDRINLA